MKKAGSSSGKPDYASLYEEWARFREYVKILSELQTKLKERRRLEEGEVKKLLSQLQTKLKERIRLTEKESGRKPTLEGEDFNPAEESTIGVVLQKAFCKPKENSWCEEDNVKNDSYNTRMAKMIAESLNSNTSQSIAEESVIETDAPSYPTPAITSDISPGESQTSHTYVEKSSSSNDLEDSSLSDDQEDSSSSDDESVLIKMNSSAKLSQETEELEASKIPEEIRDLLLNHLETNENGDRTNEKDISFKTVDFAGQEVYEVLLPLFMSSKSIYILVYSLKNDLFERAQSKVKHGKSERGLEYHFEMTNLETVEFWLSSISSYTKKGGESLVAGETQVALPPVFVACTHEDECKQNPKEVARELCTRLKSSDPCGKHVMRKVYTVNNTLSGNKKIKDKSVKRLKADIEELSKHLPQMDKDIPLNWLKFEEELSNLAENEQKKYVHLEEAARIANKCNINTAVESNEFDTLLNYLHDLKTIIYFEKTKTVFIDTQWLINMFVKVITVLPFEELKDYDADYWKKLEDEGVLQRALVEHVWKDIADDGQNTVDSLLLIMEKFSLICRWRLDEEEVFLVPCMLCNSKGSEEIEKFLADQKTSTMVIHFKNVHLPLGIFPRLIVAVAEHAKKEWPKVKQPRLRPNFCRIFKVGDKGMLDICIASGIRIICVSVCNTNNLDDESVTRFCQSVRKLLAQIVDDMHHNLPSMENMEFEYGIRCPVCTNSRKNCNSHNIKGCTRDSCLHFVSEEELKDDRPICCEDETNPDNLIKEETYTHWFPKKTDRSLDDVYKMTSDPRGFFIIINMEKFDDGDKLSERKGSEVDAKNLEELFKGFGFKTEILRDMGKQNLLSYLKTEAENPELDNHDCFGLCIMSHGKDDHFYASDGETIKVTEIRDMFKNSKCEGLKGKPKFFFIQACRGQLVDHGVQIRSDSPHRRPAGNQQETMSFVLRHNEGTIPEDADILMAYGCVEGHKSYRNEQFGSFFIQSLAKVFREHYCEEDLMSMLIKVNKEVSERDGIDGAKQMPKLETTLRKKVFFSAKSVTDIRPSTVQ